MEIFAENIKLLILALFLVHRITEGNRKRAWMMDYPW